MIINHGTDFICSSDVALGRVGPSGITLDGQSLIDVAQFIGALEATVFARGRGPRELSFTVWAFFTTEAEALAFFLTHEDALALATNLTVEDDAESVSYTMANAASSARAVQLAGLSVRIDYRFTGAKFTLDA
jgi:hypothetical protein